MKFRITRTSLWSETCPMDGAKAEEVELWSGRTGIQWFIEIKSLKALLELVKREGNIVLSTDQIEIYDSYRE